VGGAISLTLTPATASAAFLGLLAAFELLSVTWAGAKGIAWDVANLTFVYAIVLLLFAGFRGGARSRQMLVGLFALLMALVGVATLLSAARNVPGSFSLDRFAAPTGYANASAALFLIPFWGAVSLGGTPRLPIALRAIAVGSAATLATVAYVPESRGALYTFPIAAALLLVLARHRLRTAIALALAVVPVALLIRPLSRPYEAGDVGARADATHHAAVLAITVGVVVAAITAAASILDNRVRIDATARLRIVTRLAVVVAVLTAVAIGASHHPRAEASRLWSSFRSHDSAANGQTRFGSLGSNRYDFWRVSLDLAKSHPLVGVGAGNFGEEYLKHRRTGEQPAYPHSIEMTLLSETGGIGAAIFLLFFGTAALAVAKRRRQGTAEASVAAGAMTGFVYWILHGSVDWLWQFPLLGLSAFLLLGLAIAPYERGLPRKRLQLAVAATAAIVGLSFLAPWIAARQVAQASHAWRQDPAAAYAALSQASRINPLSDQPALVAGTIAAERREPTRMRVSFQQAIARDPGNWLSRTQLAVALANEQAWPAATRSAQAAVRLDPREPVAHLILDAVRSRKSPKLDAVNQAVFAELQALPGLRR
jgi:O-antigen ligase/polysaccharide polymerase Wzy-like membrane protein